MKRIIAIVVLLTLALAGTAVATDSTCVVEKHEGYLTGTGYVKVTLTANSATGGFIDVANTITHANMKGIVVYATAEPGAVTPTTGTDISVWSATGKSLFGDTGRTAVPGNDGQLSDITFLTTVEAFNINRPAHGSTTIQIRGNSVNSAVIVLYIYYSSEGFSGVSEPLDVTASGGSLAVTLDEPIETKPRDMVTTTITSQAISNGTGYTFTAVDMLNKNGVVSMQLLVEGSGTASINYAGSNDGTTYRLPAGADAEVYTGVTATSGYGSDGHVFESWTVEPSRYLQVGVNEVSAGSAITVTATLMTQ